MKFLGLTALSLMALAPLSTVAQSTFHCRSNDTRLHQLRVYEVNRANREPFHQRFQDHALRLMKKHDFKVVDMWESDTTEKLQFIYLLEWSDPKTMDARWKAFLADPEWIEIKQRTGAEHGQFVKSVQGQPLVRVTYSPACSGSK